MKKRRELRVELDITPRWWWKQEKDAIAKAIGHALTLEKLNIVEVRATRGRLLVSLGGIPGETRLEQIPVAEIIVELERLDPDGG